MSTFNNSVQLIGHLGSDIEYRELENGNKLAKVSIATNEYYKDKQGTKQVRTLWHRLIAWGFVAERMQMLLKKGSYLAVKGKLTYGDYEDKEGNRKYYSEIQVLEFHLLDKVPKPQPEEISA